MRDSPTEADLRVGARAEENDDQEDHARPAGEVESLNADAPPFGLLPALPVLPSPPTEMRPGDVYAALSDGFFEAVDAAGMEFGQERVAELLRAHRRAGAAEGLAAIRAGVREFTGDAPLDDDRTAVIVKRTA